MKVLPHMTKQTFQYDLEGVLKRDEYSEFPEQAQSNLQKTLNVLGSGDTRL